MVHTHTSAGRVHGGSLAERTSCLRDFFAVRGEPFTATQLLDYTSDTTHTIPMTVDGVPSTAYGDLLLQDGQQIVITYG